MQKNIEKIKGVFEDVILEGGKEIWCGAVILSYLLKLIQHYSLIEYFSFLHTVKQGAKLVFGGERKENAFYMPAVLTDVTADMDIAKDLEVFGPVFPIIGVDSDEEAIAVANQSSYGLAGNVCCRDIARGYKIADQIDTGGMIVNPAYVYRTFDMPFGGHKQSGIGNEGFFNTMEEMTQLKSIVLTGIKG